MFRLKNNLARIRSYKLGYWSKYTKYVVGFAFSSLIIFTCTQQQQHYHNNNNTTTKSITTTKWGISKKSY